MQGYRLHTYLSLHTHRRARRLAQVMWVCQSQPNAMQLPMLPQCGLTIDLHVSPAQVVLRCTLVHPLRPCVGPEGFALQHPPMCISPRAPVGMVSVARLPWVLGIDKTGNGVVA